ncbi:Sir2 family NAD-dependent protein deacetylase [Primorskyibacter sp. S187A]|uniref:Sir2 family NAD-dependent protein deacetylase n=1 Tax=Primorskyibacter sp. S187A TaxID=3415130 RepID=UPI003C7A6C63
MHGKLSGALCTSCHATWEAPLEMGRDTPCPDCHALTARPDIVWFGEIPHHLDAIADHLASADLFVSIGTSGQVYPAAAFVEDANARNIPTLEMSLEPTAISSQFDEVRLGPATQVVPQWVAEILS